MYIVQLVPATVLSADVADMADIYMLGQVLASGLLDVVQVDRCVIDVVDAHLLRCVGHLKTTPLSVQRLPAVATDPSQASPSHRHIMLVGNTLQEGEERLINIVLASVYEAHESLGLPCVTQEAVDTGTT